MLPSWEIWSKDKQPFFLSLSASRKKDTTREPWGRKQLGSQVPWHMRTDFLSEERQKTKTLKMLLACLEPLPIKSSPYRLNEPLNSRRWIIFPLFSAEESKVKISFKLFLILLPMIMNGSECLVFMYHVSSVLTLKSVWNELMQQQRKKSFKWGY